MPKKDHPTTEEFFGTSTNPEELLVLAAHTNQAKSRVQAPEGSCIMPLRQLMTRDCGEPFLAKVDWPSKRLEFPEDTDE